MEKYKDNVFEIESISNLYFRIDSASEVTGQHSLDFVKFENKSYTLLKYGYFVFELKSIADCKKYAEEWKDDANESNCNKENCYGN